MKTQQDRELNESDATQSVIEEGTPNTNFNSSQNIEENFDRGLNTVESDQENDLHEVGPESDDRDEVEFDYDSLDESDDTESESPGSNIYSSGPDYDEWGRRNPQYDPDSHIKRRNISKPTDEAVGHHMTLSHIKNWDKNVFNEAYLGRNNHYQSQYGKSITEPLHKVVNLVNRPEDIDDVNYNDALTLAYGNDIQFIKRWIPPIAETIELYLPSKFSDNDILRNFMIQKFRKYCITLGVHMNQGYYTFGSQEEFMKSLNLG